MKKPIIGISGNMTWVSEGSMFNFPRSFVSHDYVRSIDAAGGVPIIIPITEDDTTIANALSLCDGLLLTGGVDVSPHFYEEEPLQKIGDVFPERDIFDFTLLEMAEDAGMPILAVCRGHQVVNVFHGGSLYQDLSYDENCYIKHSQGQRPELPTHTVDIDVNSRLGEILGTPQVRTNSFHHQTVKSVGEGLVVTGRTKDGTIEAMEHILYPWLISVQFHPELMTKEHEGSQKIFKAFTEAASTYTKKA